MTPPNLARFIAVKTGRALGKTAGYGVRFWKRSSPIGKGMIVSGGAGAIYGFAHPGQKNLKRRAHGAFEHATGSTPNFVNLGAFGGRLVSGGGLD